jgi:hypothetical protein
MAFWDACSLSDTNVEAEITASETMVPNYHTKRRHCPEIYNLHIYQRGNIKSVKLP